MRSRISITGCVRLSVRRRTRGKFRRIKSHWREHLTVKETELISPLPTSHSFSPLNAVFRTPKPVCPNLSPSIPLKRRIRLPLLLPPPPHLHPPLTKDPRLTCWRRRLATPPWRRTKTTTTKAKHLPPPPHPPNTLKDEIYPTFPPIFHVIPHVACYFFRHMNFLLFLLPPPPARYFLVRFNGVRDILVGVLKDISTFIEKNIGSPSE